MVAEQTNDRQGRLRVFLSYSRKDQQTAVWLRGELEAHGVEVFRDVDDTLPGEVWWQRLQDLIAKSDAVVFVLSPHSATSSVCGDEVEHAHTLSKRIFPVTISDVDWETVPEGLSRVHSVSFAEDDARPAAVQQLCDALSTNIDWVREHTRLYERAVLWETRGRSRHELLRGRALNEAEAWLDTQPQNAEPPTPLHREFFQASRDAARQRRAFLTGGLIAGLLLAISLTVVAFWQRHIAQQATGRAQRAQEEAERQEGIATDASGKAQAASIQAQASEAKTRRTLATSLFVRASREIADRNTPEALAFLSRAVQVDPEYRSARVRLFSLLTARRHAVPLVAFSINQRDLLSPPQFHPELSHFYDGERTWDLDSLDLVSNAIDLSWAHHRTVTRGADEAALVLMPAMAARDPKTLLLTDASQGAQNPLQMFRHEGNVTYFEFSPNGDRVVTCSDDGTARIWATDSGQPQGEPMQHQLPVTMARFSSDDTRVLTTSADNTAALWNASTGDRIGTPFVHQADVLGGNFSDDGSRVATWTSEPVVCVWLPADNGRGPFVWFGGFQGAILDARFSSDGSLLAVALTDGTARVFDIGDARQFRQHCEPVPHGSPVRWVNFASDGNRIATAGKDAVTRVWQLPQRSDASDTESREILLAENGREVEIKRDPDDGDRVIETSTGKTIATFDEVPSPIAISPSGRYLLDTFELQVFDTTTGGSVQPEVPDNGGMIRRMESGRAFEFSPDESQLLTLHRDDVARIWELPGGKHLHDIAVESSLKLPAGIGAQAINVGLKSARWNADGTSVAIVSRHIGIFDSETGKQQFELKSSQLQSMSDIPACVAFAPTGNLIAGGYTAAPIGRIQIWDATTGEATGLPITQGVVVVSLAFSRDGTRIVAGSGNGVVRVYDVATREALTDVIQVSGQLKSVCFSASETQVIVATTQSVQAWDLATSRPVTDWIPVRRRPLQVNPMPNGTHIRVEYDNGSSQKFAIDWPQTLPPGQLTQQTELAAALAGQYLTVDTNVMQSLDSFQVLTRLRLKLRDEPILTGVKTAHLKTWSLSEWIDQHPQPESLQDLKLLSLRFPPVPLSQARLAVMWAAFEGTTPEETKLSKVLGEHNAEMAQLGQIADPRAYYYLSRYYLMTGNRKRARSMAERALQHDASSERFLKQLQAVDKMSAEDGPGVDAPEREP